MSRPAQTQVHLHPAKTVQNRNMPITDHSKADRTLTELMSLRTCVKVDIREGPSRNSHTLLGSFWCGRFFTNGFIAKVVGHPGERRP